MELSEKLSLIGLLPVVKLKSEENALPLAEALSRGGLNAAEITFRTSAAEGSIRRIAKARPDFLIAAGTVLSPENADRAAAAGAQLIVSPGFNAKVVEHCLKKGYPVVPGVSSPSEIELALSYGLSTLKLFPAEVLGGVKMLKALSGPYGSLRFMPTGGIDEKNLPSYLAMPNVLCCGGSWMVSEDPAVAEKKTAAAVSAMLSLRLDVTSDKLRFTAPSGERAAYYLEKNGYTVICADGELARLEKNGAEIEIAKENRE